MRHVPPLSVTFLTRHAPPSSVSHTPHEARTASLLSPLSPGQVQVQVVNEDQLSELHVIEHVHIFRNELLFGLHALRQGGALYFAYQLSQTPLLFRLLLTCDAAPLSRAKNSNAPSAHSSDSTPRDPPQSRPTLSRRRILPAPRARTTLPTLRPHPSLRPPEQAAPGLCVGADHADDARRPHARLLLPGR